MAKERRSSRSSTTRSSNTRSGSAGAGKRESKGKGKVGSDRAADREVGGKGDFGIPSEEVRAPLPIGGRDKGPDQGTGYMRSGTGGVRTDGVAHAPGPPGAGSGGDVDPDVIGLDKKGGVAARAPSGRTKGPDITEGGSGSFASGAPARPENQLPTGTHGGPSQIVHGSTVDRSGGDASTTGSGGGADSTQSSLDREGTDIPDDAAAGEISSDEATGQGG